MDITITIAVIVISICCVITIKIFTKDDKMTFAKTLLFAMIL